MNCSWLLHPGSRWMPNVFISSEIGSRWPTILGHPQPIECMGICILSLAHGSEQRGSDAICILWKTDLENFLWIRAGYVPLDGLCLEFFRDFWFFFFGGGSVGQIIHREYIVFRGSNISCSLATVMFNTMQYRYSTIPKYNTACSTTQFHSIPFPSHAMQCTNGYFLCNAIQKYKTVKSKSF